MSTSEVHQIVVVIKTTGFMVGFITYLATRTKIHDGAIVGLLLSILVTLLFK